MIEHEIGWFVVQSPWLDGWFYDGFGGAEMHRVRPNIRGAARAVCGHEKLHHWQYDETKEPALSCRRCLDLEDG